MEQPSAAMDAAHQLWGLWQFTADPAAGTLEMVPIRGAAMHLNALKFLEPPPNGFLTLEHFEFNGSQVTTDIGLRHPFLGFVRFTGFDVCGIFITSGNVTGFDDAELRMAGDGDTRLVNPDGYTRWWNPSEFPINDGTMFSYQDGLLGTPHSVANFNCTLNAYRYFADGLDLDDGLDSVDPEARGVFSAGKKNARRYIIQLDSGLVFNYAVDACWNLPDGSPPWDVPDDFGPGANRPEAWRISVTEMDNTLWNDGIDSGGELNLSVDVYDHFDADMNTVKIESPGNFDITSSGIPNGGGIGYSTYEIEIADATPAPDSIDLFITVECEKSGYGGLLPGKVQAAYFTGAADVSGESPIDGIFIDGDNADDPLEDGTKDHPFDDIMEGVLAAGVPPYDDVYDVYVDPYDDGVTEYPYFKFYQKARVHGYSWNGGPRKPLITANSQFGLAYDVNDCLVENLEFHVYCPYDTNNSHCIQFGNAHNFTIKDCKFSGFAQGANTYILYIVNCHNFRIEHNEFVGIRNRSQWGGGHNLYIINMRNSDDAVIINNEMHDIGYDDEGAPTSDNWTCTCLIYFLRDDKDHCENAQVLNNLIYDIKDYSLTSGDAQNHIQIFGWNAIIGTLAMPDFTYANNTVDDFSEVVADPLTVKGAIAGCYGAMIDNTWTVKNSIFSNMSPITQGGGTNGHRGFWADSSEEHVAVTHSCCYNFGNPDSGSQMWDYVNFMTKGTGSFGLDDNEDPAYDMTPGPNWYHVTNPALLSDDGSEMGAFGGPYGDWTPPSQE